MDSWRRAPMLHVMAWHGMAWHCTARHGMEVNDSNVEDEGSVKTMKMGKFIGS